MNINYEPHREGMTVLPAEVSEMTGHTLHGTEQVKQTKGMGFDHSEDDDWEYNNALEHQVQQEDPDSPEYVSEEIRIADTFESVMANEEVCTQPEMGEAVLAADIGDTPAATVVQHLAYRYTQGESPESLFQEAVSTGVNPDALMQAYWTLVEAFDHG